MKKALCLVALMGLVAAASADVNFYLTVGPAVGDGHTFDTGAINFLPYYTGYDNTLAHNPQNLDPGTYTLSLWAEFDGHTPYTQIFGIQADVAGSATFGQNVMYRHKKTNGTPAQRWTRWDADAGLAMDLGICAAVTANGIVYNQPGDGSYDLYDDTYGIALLGAVEVTGDAGQNLTVGLGPLGLIARDGDTGEDIRPPVSPASVAFVPEPASLVLLALGALLRRR